MLSRHHTCIQVTIRPIEALHMFSVTHSSRRGTSPVFGIQFVPSRPATVFGKRENDFP
ncbi:hypothetical protein IWQ61_004961 [Dispira simplex]|nr:hypothetical protein IWQ61_004961 [Dispira simplex]